MVMYVIYKAPFYLWFKFFSFAWGIEGMVTYDNEFKTKENAEFKQELNHNIILHMNYLILVSTRVPALINISTI